jgi:hypothetical protein
MRRFHHLGAVEADTGRTTGRAPSISKETTVTADGHQSGSSAVKRTYSAVSCRPPVIR